MLNAGRFCRAAILGISSLALMSISAMAEPKYDTGAGDNFIRIGNIMPYSGPASAYSSAGKALTAYFAMINDTGGINGRKIEFISYDDGYSPAKTVEQTRRLVENDDILLVFNVLGTPSNLAIQKFLNARKIPQLFVASGASRFGDPKQFPWTMGWQPTYYAEGLIYGRYLLEHHPDMKIGVLVQNDDFGRELLNGLKQGLGGKAGDIVAVESYEVTEPTIDSRVVRIKSAGADVIVNITTSKFAAQSIKKVAELGWQPVQIVDYISSSVGGVMKPVGFQQTQGILSASYTKDPTDAQWREDEGVRRFEAFLAKYMPEGNRSDSLIVYGYNVAQTLVQVLRQSADDLTRANIMKQAASLKGFVPDMVLPGVSLNTAADDYFPLKKFSMMRFEGERWKMFGGLIEANKSSDGK